MRFGKWRGSSVTRYMIGDDRDDTQLTKFDSDTITSKIVSVRGVFMRLMYYEDYSRHGCLVKYFTQVRSRAKVRRKIK